MCKCGAFSRCVCRGFTVNPLVYVCVRVVHFGLHFGVVVVIQSSSLLLHFGVVVEQKNDGFFFFSVYPWGVKFNWLVNTLTTNQKGSG